MCPSSHNHGSGKWPPWRLKSYKSSSRPSFSTSMIMGVGERVNQSTCKRCKGVQLTLPINKASTRADESKRSMRERVFPLQSKGKNLPPRKCHYCHSVLENDKEIGKHCCKYFLSKIYYNVVHQLYLVKQEIFTAAIPAAKAVFVVSGFLWTGGTSRSTSSLGSRTTMLPASAIFKDRFKEKPRGK